MAKGRGRIRGIKNRWIFNSLGIVVLVLLLAIGAFSVSVSDYYYCNMRTSLMQRAQSTSKFFNSYLNSSYSSYYTSAYRYAETYEEKNNLELQFVNSPGRLEVSTSGAKAGFRPGTDDLVGALKNGEMTSWVGRDPETGERIMAVSSPLKSSNNQVVGAVRYVTSLRLVDRQVFLMLFGALAIGGVVILFVILSSMFFIRSIVAPVQEINDIAKRIAKGSYGIKIEKEFDYKGLSKKEIVAHLVKFISGIWQIHPFAEGNTRTTAVFTIKYLYTLGFETNNDLFEQHSKYFRNALVRANYQNLDKGIPYTMTYLNKFFGNLLLDEENALDNREMQIWEGKSKEKSKEKILNLIHQNPSITTKELAEMIGLSIAGIEKNLRQMKENNQIRRVGPDKGGYWEVIAN